MTGLEANGTTRTPRALLSFFVMAAALSCAAAFAQATIEAPPPQFVSPGDYVTLIFVVHPSASGAADVELSAPAGWQVLGAQASVNLEAGTPKPVAYTVGVPATGAPNATKTFTLSVTLGGTRVSAETRLHILPQPGIRLDVPTQVPIDAGKVVVRLKNTGNVALHLTVSFGRGTSAHSTRTLELAAQDEHELDFEVHQGGSYDVTVAGPGAIAQSRTVTVVAYGVPAPCPYSVRFRAAAYLASDGTWRVDASGDGPLSNDAQLSTHISASAPMTSFAEVGGHLWSVRLGAVGTDSFDLGLPSPFGVAAQFGGNSWATFVSGGSLQTNGWEGFGGAAWIDAPDHVVVAGAAGMANGAPVVALSTSKNEANEQLGLQASWAEGRLDATAQASASKGSESVRVRAHAGTNSTGTSTAALAVGYRSNDAALSASGSLDLAKAQPTSGLIRFGAGLPSLLHSNLRLDTQVGMDASYAYLLQDAHLGGWTTSNRVGLVWDQYGRAASATTSWQSEGTDYFGFDALVRVGLDGSGVRGSLGARGQLLLGPLLVFGGVRADGLAQSAAARAGAQWQSGDLTVTLTGDLDTNYVAPASSLSGTVRLRATYSFPVNVPAPITELAGGWNEGEISGSVEGAAAIPDLVVLIGPYRVHIGRDGGFTARLRPGDYPVRLDPRSVPIQYRIEQPQQVTVKVTSGKTSHVRLRLSRGAGVAGTILLDSTGDGTPDAPSRGVPATVSLVDASGAFHTTTTDASGRYAFRSLPGGTANITISGLPLGDALEGQAQRQLDVVPGKTIRVDYLVKPAASVATVFGNAHLSLRSVHSQTSRVPPGSAPLIDVVTSAPASSVAIESPAGRIALAGSGRRWSGRLPVPAGTSPGLYVFTVVAKRGSESAHRQDHVIIDPQVPLLTADVARAVLPGETLSVSAKVIADANKVLVSSSSSVGIQGRLAPSSPGTWSANLPVAGDLKPGRYVLTIEAFDGSHVLARTTVNAIVRRP